MDNTNGSRDSNGRFVPGSGVAGRPKGLQNKKTVEQRNRAKSMLQAMEDHPRFMTMLDTMDDKTFANMYKDLLDFDAPRLARQEHTDSNGGPLVITVKHTMQPLPPAPPTASIEDAEYTALPDSNKPF